MRSRPKAEKPQPLVKLEPDALEKAVVPTSEQIQRALDQGMQAAARFESAARQQARIDPRIRFARS